jgi:flagellar assembly factor FliW
MVFWRLLIAQLCGSGNGCSRTMVNLRAPLLLNLFKDGTDASVCPGMMLKNHDNSLEYMGCF